MKHLILLLLLFGSIKAQNTLSFAEYVGYVKSYHPVVKQAQLRLSESEAKLLKARGLVDPKIDINYDDKDFESTNYYQKLGGTFTVPTWYGVQLKGGFNDNNGVYLNPENKLTDNGLYHVGVSVSLARGLLMNERLLAKKQAENYIQQTEQKNILQLTDILYDSFLAYFEWWKYQQEQIIMAQFVDNAKVRFYSVKRSFELGDKPAIDTVEAHMNWKERALELEKLNLLVTKARLKASNYLWLNDLPLEIKDEVQPTDEVLMDVQQYASTGLFSNEEIIRKHPYIKSLELQGQNLKLKEKFAKNNLLPQLDVQYNLLSENFLDSSNFLVDNYKAGIQFSMPIFFRKQRAELKINKYQQESLEWNLKNVSNQLLLKWQSLEAQSSSYKEQIGLAKEVVSNAQDMVDGEKRRFEIGESSIFLVNARESKWLEKSFKLIDLQEAELQTLAEIFRMLTIEAS